MKILLPFSLGLILAVPAAVQAQPAFTAPPPSTVVVQDADVRREH